MFWVSGLPQRVAHHSVGALAVADEGDVEPSVRGSRPEQGRPERGGGGGSGEETAAGKSGGDMHGGINYGEVGGDPFLQSNPMPCTALL